MGNKCKIFKKCNEHAGITLVALVVTIVVLLILSGISLKLVLDKDGIIKQAGEAKNQYEQDETNSETRMSEMANYIKKETSDPSLPQNENGSSIPYLPSKSFKQVEGTDLSNGLVIEDKAGNQYVWIEVPKTTAIYRKAGIDVTSFTVAKLDYIKADLIYYANAYRNDNYSDTWYDGCGVTQENYTTMYNKMLKSVYQNGGFWIGRYEIGINENTVRSYGSDTSTLHPTTGQTPVIKANKVPYNWIRCSQAEELAETFAPSGYTSSLMFGLQWDLVLKYLETNGATQEELKETTTGSKNWGNYDNASFTVTNINAQYSEDNGASWNPITAAGYTKDSSKSRLLTTGANETRNSKMNICDLAGNVWEWTLEQYTSFSSYPCSGRGGHYSGVGSDHPASHRYSLNTTGSNSYNGARVTLY